LTLALLAPAPVFAFHWLQTTWTVVSTLGTNAPQPSWNKVDGTNGAGDTGQLTVDMHSASVANAGASIELTRQMQVNNGERITVTRAYQALLQNASLSVKVWFDPVILGSGANGKTAFNFSRSAGNVSGGKTPHDSGVVKSTTFTLPTGSAANDGEYVVHVRITYTTKSNSSQTNTWKNPNPLTASSHTFTFAGS
jgi:hypothetical protein